MLISYKWLTELVSTDLEPKELAEKLTLIGLEIDGIHERDGDVVFDIEITSNRGDCLSHLGVAREVSAFSGNAVSFPGSLDDLPSESGRVEILAPELCPRFTARIIRDVKVGPSPKWLVDKLESVGERSINNIADITNFVMHELGQPMHSFDLDKLNGKRIIVRNAGKGEKITTLDEVERKLDESILVICDAEKPAAVAGVMGGFNSGITEGSTNVLLEVACFERDSIRKTSRLLNLATEASFRFERGVDIENLIRASNRAAELMCELAGGTLDEFTDIYPEKPAAVTITADNVAGELLRLSGIDMPSKDVDDLLCRLGITKTGDSDYHVPTWRHDLSIPEDLVEEAVRIYGYDRIAESIPSSRGAGEYHRTESRKRKLRSALAERGFGEAISYSFVDSGFAASFSSVSDLRDAETTAVTIKDPIIEGADLMRPSLLPGLVEAVRTNLNHKNRDLRMFEIGRVFSGASDAGSLPVEKETLAIVISGRESLQGSALPGREFDYYDLKAAVEEAAEALGSPDITFFATEKPSHLQNGQSALVGYGDEIVGSAGKLKGDISAELKLKQPVFIAEIDLETFLAGPGAVSVYKPLDVFPSVIRDVSLVVADDVSYHAIEQTILNGEYDYFERTSYVDTYLGEGIGDSERSVTIRLEYRSQERTLTDEDVDSVHESVLADLKKGVNARFR